MAGSTTEPPSVLARRLMTREPNRYASWLDRDACRAVVANGLPDVRAEPWKYTNVNRWYDVALDDPTPGSLGIDVPAGVGAFDFEDDRARDLAGLHRGKAFELAEQPLAAVNGLLLGAGTVIVVPRDRVVADPIRVEHAGAAYEHILLVVEAGASITLIEEPADFVHRIVEAVVEPGGRLRHLRRQRSTRRRECSLVAVHLADDARYALAQSSRGADLRRNDVVVTLGGSGAGTTVNGVWRLAGREHLDNQIAVRHVAPHGTSRQTYRGVAADRARAVLNGRIHIASGANDADATLDTKNLLATDRAEVYAKPELTIYESDIRCSHGATVGTLDEETVFFLRARGLSDDDARGLLVRGFLREAIADEEGAAALRLAP